MQVSCVQSDQFGWSMYQSQLVSDMEQLWLLWLILPAYWLISLFFLCFPNILHSKKKYANSRLNQLVDSDMLFCIGHRGGGFEGPQNTLEVFRLNAPHSHAFELDICMTKDGQLVVHHDLNLRRTCGLNEDICNINYKDLPHFMEEFETFGGGGVLKTVKNKIPLLDELFAEFPDMPMNIDLKTPRDGAVEEFNRLVRKHDREEITIWGSMNASANQQLNEINEKVIAFYSTGEILKITLLTLFGLLPFWCLRQGVLDIPLMTIGFQEQIYRFSGSGCKKCLACFFICLIKIFNLLGRLFIPHLRKRGILTFYWIVNDQEGFEDAVDSGCAGVMTDRTAFLAEYLKKHNRFFQGSSDSF